MKTLGLALLLVGIALAVASAGAAGTASLNLTSAQDGGTFVWKGGGASNPALHADAGASVTITVAKGDDTAGVPHNVHVTGGGIDKKSDDVSNAGDSQTITFTAPESGTLTYQCDYHSTMKGTITVGTASTGGSTDAKKSPGTQLVGLTLALAGVALLVGRRAK